MATGLSRRGSILSQFLFLLRKFESMPIPIRVSNTMAAKDRFNDPG